MATNELPLPPLGKITIRVDRVYGKVVTYPVCERAKLIAQLARTKTLTHGDLCLAERLGFEIVLDGCSANAMLAAAGKSFSKEVS